MTTRARLASNTAQAISASAENSENERENEVTDDESSLTVGARHIEVLEGGAQRESLVSTDTPVKEGKRYVD